MAVFLAAAMVGGCGLWLGISASILTAVNIVGVEGLTPPAVSGTKAYAIDRRMVIDPDAASPGEAACFILALDAVEPDRVRMRLQNLEAEVTQELAYVSPAPPNADRILSASSPPLDDATRAMLQSGQALFWHAGSAAGAVRPLQRFAVLIPRTVLSPFNRLDIFKMVNQADEPVVGDYLELVDGFFYMATIGDSVPIGNGLYDDQKYANRIARLIERRTRRKVIHQLLAVSSASIVPDGDDTVCGPGCYPEAPTTHTSITLQAKLIQRPEVQDLILVNGCLNDVGFLRVLLPGLSIEELATRCDVFCGQAMQDLLLKVVASAPRARIVVTGYYPLVSERSNLELLDFWIRMILPGTDETIRQLNEVAALHSQVFSDASGAASQTAVDRINALLPDGPRIRFVDPGFGPDNAILAPDAWLWGVRVEPYRLPTLMIPVNILPEDPKLMERFGVCRDDHTGGRALMCYYTSVGHPNSRGATAYTEAITQALEEMGLVPIAP